MLSDLNFLYSNSIISEGLAKDGELDFLTNFYFYTLFVANPILLKKYYLFVSIYFLLMSI